MLHQFVLFLLSSISSRSCYVVMYVMQKCRSRLKIDPCLMQAGAWSQTLQSAVSNLIDNHSITVVVATGNSQVDACEITPANVNGTLAVAGSDMSSKFDTTQTNSDILYEYDNTGSCVDIFAPGVDIMAACGGAGNNFPWKITF